MVDEVLEGSYPATFVFQGNKVRVLTRKGQPWFVAMDVCNCLGLQPKYARQRLDESELGYVARTDLGLPAGKRMCLFSEPGLYTVIMRSDKPQARPFQLWVTREVLPAIRKDGMYVMGEEKVRTGEMTEDELILKAMTLLKGKIDRFEQERDHYHGIVQEHLVNLTLDAWKALNSHYLSQSETSRLAARTSKKLQAQGLKPEKEPRELELLDGKVIFPKVNVYPKALIDEAALELGIPVNMKFDLVPLS